MSSGSRSRFVLSAALGLSFISCGRSSTQPSPVASEPVVVIARLEIVAPQQMDLGTTAQLIASAVKSDGSVENVTTRAQWTVQSSTSSAILSLTAPGLVRGIDVGRGSLTAQLGSFTADATIVVLATPSEDFRGVYTLTVAGADCRDGFPEHAEVRVYSAAVGQTGTRLHVSLSGANFPFGGSQDQDPASRRSCSCGCSVAERPAVPAIVPESIPCLATPAARVCPRRSVVPVRTRRPTD
jgi:hypothetical protein